MIPTSRRFSWLTDREREVLALMLDGKCATQIASDTYLGVPTVRTHIRSILMKLGVNTQLQAVALVHCEMFDEAQRREAFQRAVG